MGNRDADAGGDDGDTPVNIIGLTVSVCFPPSDLDFVMAQPQRAN